MSKLIITISLFMFSIWANAQIELAENYTFKRDKQYHAIAGTVISSGTFLLVYNKTNDENLAFRAAWMSTAFAGLAKEIADGVQGREVSLADMSYTIVTGLFTAYVMKTITKHRQKKRIKKMNDFWDLDNPIFINKQNGK